jgi:hypothetical protein
MKTWKNRKCREMGKTERLEIIKFLEQYKRDLIKQVLLNIAKGNNDNKDKAVIIRDINKQLMTEKAKTR